MNQKVSRKDFLRTGAKYAAGAAVGIGALNVMETRQMHAAAQLPDWPWPYAALDVEQVRKDAHDAYWSGKGCSYGAFYGIIKSLQSVVGEPYTTFPSEMMIYGHGGGAGWGATCGAINGAAALLSLVRDKAGSDKLVNELYGWYTQVELPTPVSNQYGIDNAYGVNKIAEALTQNKSHSPLCHASVTLWCEASGKKVADVDRKERCARLTGDVAAYTVQLLNEDTMGQFNPLYVVPVAVDECNACHGKGMIDNVAAKMECDRCHGDNPHASGINPTGGVASGFDLSGAYPNPFNPTTTMKISLPKGEHVQLYVFDAHGRLISKILDGEFTAAGVYEASWNGMSEFGIPVASGTYFARLTAGSFTKTRKLLLTK